MTTPGGAIPGHEYYHAGTRIVDADVLVTLNGFPVVEQERSARPTVYSAPLNLALAGEENVLLWRVDWDPRGRAPVCELQIHRYVAGEMATALDGPASRRVMSWSLTDWLAMQSDRRRAPEPPVTLSERFDAPEHRCFQDVLRRCSSGPEVARCVAYGRKIRALFQRGDVAALEREFAVKIAADAYARGKTLAETRARFREVMATFVAAELDTASDVTTYGSSRWCGERVVRVRRDDGRPLLLAHDPRDDVRIALDVYVGEVDGALCVVR